jgi:hypothetical protein
VVKTVRCDQERTALVPAPSGPVATKAPPGKVGIDMAIEEDYSRYVSSHDIEF